MKKFINAVIYGYDDATEILVEDGKFKAIGSNLETGDDVEVIDLEGRFVVPPYVDSHLHLDYAYTNLDDESENESGTLFEGIERWSSIKKSQTIEDVKARARRALYEEVSQGVQYVRSHVDVTDPSQTGLKALLELKDELKDKVYIQIVAFPQEGMYAYPNGAELVEEAVKMGADAVGGIPHFEYYEELGNDSVKKTVELALKYDKLIDVHTDETDDPNSRHVSVLNGLVLANDYGKKTTASHTVSFARADDAYAYRQIQLFQKSGMNFISNPTENAYLQGRYGDSEGFRGITRVRDLWHAGVNVSFGQDSIADPWYPMGNGNMMNILDNGIHLAQTMDENEIEHVFDFITYNGAKTLHIQDEYGLEAGKPANFLVLDAPNNFEAVRQRASVLASVRNGEYLFKKKKPEYDVALEL